MTLAASLRVDKGILAIKVKLIHKLKENETTILFEKYQAQRKNSFFNFKASNTNGERAAFKIKAPL